MSGGASLGLRSSGSYGSLQQSGCQSPTPSPPLAARKPAKMSLSGAGRGILCARICKLAGRRQRMLLLFLVTVAVAFCFLFSSLVNRDEDAPPGTETMFGFSDHVRSFVNPAWTSSSRPVAQKDSLSGNGLNSSSQTEKQSNNGHGKVQGLLSSFPPAVVLDHHACENFSFSPPPIDRKRTGARPCPVCYLPVEQALTLRPSEPSASPVLQSLNYLFEENLIFEESNGGSLFGGYPSQEERDKSYDIKESMTVRCGFVRGKIPGRNTGFDIDEADLSEMQQCQRTVVASAIFGNYDIMQQPESINEFSKNTVCFFMFLDEETEAAIKNFTTIDHTKRIGLWRVVVVHNLPYSDARRNGKVPKLLLHRLFPNARYSIWIDGKLKLVRDPYQVLERFLWRKNVSFAISRHYKRFDVFEEAEANKAGGKYDNASIDYQIEFYKREGLTHYSSAKLPITSDVPEGCVIIREHIPITNLFTCLWFNEVDRFTSRDQLSFSTVRDKIRSRVNWTADMFLDCERRDFVVQTYHRELLEQRQAALRSQPPPRPPAALMQPRKMLPDNAAEEPGKSPATKKLPAKHTRDRKSSSKRTHRTKVAGGKESVQL
ncbi:probable hexosyltransferase MUCI70 [Phragmites australis]|uniref:probable hexosyltransferase MUCI70 n=1 Tax=Phragmites australis TaxID=29695 RepID=UPI002D794B87|nr:probable hexosyltransferase MUCI70 [Phragmites australis]